ncbi:uncharacterized protein LOC124433573 isoform X2 [Xenia sp. Carnegie-2017]|uniref:uncharacterized protein LOC124433573 isoform X2 n=1 Tax=Xenia sp. Carnegie-2017 TaxID=2897299 RepID=UPI001F04E266|nr:uncharacterized protein LOC124433573 isoform X2 [Xenia sp. Carnegie-2017]
MPSIVRFPPYVIVVALGFTITLFLVYNSRQRNDYLERKVGLLQLSLSESKEKNNVKVKDAIEKIKKKELEMKKLQQESARKLGELRAKIRLLLKANVKEIKNLHESSDSSKAEISKLAILVEQSRGRFGKLSEKADRLILEHTKLKNEKTNLQEMIEKLQNEVGEKQAEKEEINEQLASARKENINLLSKVNDLKKKNDIIQQAIKQKIKVMRKTG